MSTAPARSRGLLGHRRLQGVLLAGGTAILVVASVVGFSGAYFTSSSRSPGNEFTAAGMGLSLAVTEQIVDGAGMAPGDVRTGDQTVTNAGHLGLLVLVATDLEVQPLSQVLQLSVRQTDPAVTEPVYTGPLDGLTSVDLGNLAKDERRTFRFTVTWPESATSPGLAGTSTSLAFDWRLESVPESVP